MYSTQSQAVEGGSAGWEPSRGLPGTEGVCLTL